MLIAFCFTLRTCRIPAALTNLITINFICCSSRHNFLYLNISFSCLPCCRAYRIRDTWQRILCEYFLVVLLLTCNASIANWIRWPGYFDIRDNTFATALHCIACERFLCYWLAWWSYRRYQLEQMEHGAFDANARSRSFIRALFFVQWLIGLPFAKGFAHYLSRSYCAFRILERNKNTAKTNRMKMPTKFSIDANKSSRTVSDTMDPGSKKKTIFFNTK